MFGVIIGSEHVPLDVSDVGHAGKNLACSMNGLSDSFHRNNAPPQKKHRQPSAHPGMREIK